MKKIISLILAAVLVLSALVTASFGSTAPGDADGDGKVNAKDVSALLKKLSGWEIAIRSDLADVNCDGSVGAKDAAAMLKHLAGWNVELATTAGYTGEEIVPPAEPRLDIPDRTVYVTDAPYNAAGDGITDDRAAIQKAIDETAAAGGGTVVLTGGKTFLVSGLTLRSHIGLLFGDKTVLLQNARADSYVVPSENGYESFAPVVGHNVPGDVLWYHAWHYNYPLIYAPEGTESVSITGNGIIRMADADSCAELVHVCPIGLYRTSDFVIDGVTVERYHSYAIMPYTCDRGIIRNVTVRDPRCYNCDGISMQNCRDIRVTGCSLTTEDDSCYVFTSYRDPRGQTWWSSEDPAPSRRIEIDHNYCSAGLCKAFCFILWGVDCPDLSLVEASDVNVHDNDLELVGSWYQDPYSVKQATAPVKRFRFADNKVKVTDPSFFAPTVSDADGYPSSPVLINGGFDDGEVFWILADGASVEDGCGNIDRSVGGARIYEGLTLSAGVTYRLGASVRSTGEACRVFVRDGETGALVMSREFTNTDWETTTDKFTVPSDGRYLVGLESTATGHGMAQIDNVTLAVTGAYTIFGDSVPELMKDEIEYELGTLFSVTSPGKITAVRVYTPADEGGVHTVRLWDADAEMTVVGPIEWDIPAGVEGWRELTLDSPVSVEPGKRYIIAVSTGSATIYAQSCGKSGFAAPRVSGGIVTYADSGVYSDVIGAMPTMVYDHSNYFRDIVFTVE